MNNEAEYEGDTLGTAEDPPQEQDYYFAVGVYGSGNWYSLGGLEADRKIAIENVKNFVGITKFKIVKVLLPTVAPPAK